MQTDMHYYGTYTLARAAGLKPEAARIIATASQYVDDAAETRTFTRKDHSCILAAATGHHNADIENLLPMDQRQVWVPFHFLPGNAGNSFEERLQCGKNSQVAKDMVKANLAHALSGSPFALELLGVTAHVYADTFSHFGFSGIGSDFNRVKNETINVNVADPEIKKYITGKAERFFKKRGVKGIKALYQKMTSVFVGGAAELLSAGLGHGAVATYPDRPYLRWDFHYEKGNRPQEVRDNRSDYLEACKAMHALFSDFSAKTEQLSDPRSRCRFKEIEGTLSEILSAEKDMDGRIAAWQNAVKERKVFDATETGIPEYNSGIWDRDLASFDAMAVPSDAVDLSVYRFHQAASFHRHTVLRQLLPSQKLVVV